MICESRIRVVEEVNAAYHSAHRNFKDYADAFYLAPEQMRGKKFLDVGAGDSSFARQAQDYGATVVRLDGRYSDTTKIQLNSSLPEESHLAVTAFAQELPFKEDSFDEALALASFNWMKTKVEDVLFEMIRVVKVGGYIKIAPAYHQGRSFSVELPLNASIVENLNPQYAYNNTLVIKKTPLSEDILHKEIEELIQNRVCFDIL